MSTELGRMVRAVEMQTETDTDVILAELATMLRYDRKCQRPETIVTLSRFAALIPYRLSPWGSVVDLDHHDLTSAAFHACNEAKRAANRGGA